MSAPSPGRYAAYVERMQPALDEQHDEWAEKILGEPADAVVSAGWWSRTYGNPVLTREKVDGVWVTVLRQQITLMRGDVVLRRTAEVRW